MVRKKADDGVETYTTEITFECPVRGTVKQKIKVKKYKSAERAHPIEVPTDELFKGLEDEDDNIGRM
jgi:hypothetical protein